jgi:cell fate regulator YaaT (PSP1 superfamily)
MDDLEYLLSYGRLGDFGRFRSAKPLACGRGDRAVVRTHRGLEVGEVLRPAAPGHATFLPNTSVGQLLRLLTANDEEALARSTAIARSAYGRAARITHDLALPLEVIDAEVLLDGEHGVIHLLRWEDCDVRPFVSTLSREFALHITLADLTRSSVAQAGAEEEEHAGCGRPDCGAGKGGCSTCGSGGGCGTCGAARPKEVQAYFAGLRQKMDEQRVALL